MSRKVVISMLMILFSSFILSGKENITMVEVIGKYINYANQDSSFNQNERQFVKQLVDLGIERMKALDIPVLSDTLIIALDTADKCLLITDDNKKYKIGVWRGLGLMEFKTSVCLETKLLRKWDVELLRFLYWYSSRILVREYPHPTMYTRIILGQKLRFASFFTPDNLCDDVSEEELMREMEKYKKEYGCMPWEK